MEFKPKNREWVKNAAIAFLAVLLVLTFFSNTFMNRSLPEVATVGVTDGSIVAKVRGTGTVKANGAHEVKLTQTREVRSVMVRVGQEVNAGDTLFVLGAGDSEELESAKEALRDMQYAYQKAAISMPNFNYRAEQLALERAAKAQNEAASAYDIAAKAYEDAKKTLGGSDQQVMEQVELARKKMEAAQANYAAVQASYDQNYVQLSSVVAAWQNRVNELSAQQEIKPIPTTEPSPTAPPTFPPDPSSSPEIQSSPSVESLSAGELGGRIALLSSVSSMDPGQCDDLELARQYLASAQAELAAFVSTNRTTLDEAKSAYEDARARYDALKAQGDKINYQLLPYKEALDRAGAKLDEANIAYDEANTNLIIKQQNDNKTLTVAGIDLQQQAEKIKLQQEKVKMLSGEAGDEVKANVTGTVTSIGCTSGDTVTKDTVMCTIEVPDSGYTLSFSVTNDQAQRLRPGDTATVSNYYWGKEIVAKLATIATDPKNPQTNKLLTFDVSGDVSSGTELSISVGQKSANYDVIVPKSAIRSDSNGSFVLAIQAKSSPLGNRYIAKRVSVEVLASDDENAAVVAELGWGDYVITTSNAPVKAGDQVRMAETNT